MDPPQHIYHEKQIRELCAMHALNNLLQARDCYTKPMLDGICKSMSPNEWINPHRSILGLGNYDINVIIKALELRGLDAVWFDKRKDPACLDPDKIVGFIFNVPTDYKIGFVALPFKRRHWIAIRRIGDTFWNLDSKLDAPESIGNEESLKAYFRAQLESNDKELFVVVNKRTEEDHSWMIQT